MAVALAKPDSKMGRGADSAKVASQLGLSSEWLRQARFVLRHCRDMAEEVLRNAKYPLTVAYEEAQAMATPSEAMIPRAAR